jgi:hypothetical protein
MDMDCLRFAAQSGLWLSDPSWRFLSVMSMEAFSDPLRRFLYLYSSCWRLVSRPVEVEARLVDLPLRGKFYCTKTRSYYTNNNLQFDLKHGDHVSRGGNVVIRLM